MTLFQSKHNTGATLQLDIQQEEEEKVSLFIVPVHTQKICYLLLIH